MIYMVVGSPGSGKSWVCNQLKELFEYIPHDEYMENKRYVRAILDKKTEKPILIEAPFSMSELIEPLEAAGKSVEPIIILEKESTLRERYRSREKKDIPQGHLSRQKTYADRARKFGFFSGTSEEVLGHLRNVPHRT